MANYTYSLNDTEEINVIHTEAKTEDEIINQIWNNLLNQERHTRFNQLLRDNHPLDYDDVETMKLVLPMQYKPFAYDLDKLREQLVSMHEITNMYTISNLKLGPKCDGCLYNQCGQVEHMECPDGCLHQAEYCEYCNYP